MTKHLILIGFMGTGKTTVGRIAAELLQMPFVDLDLEVTKQTGLAPHHYIPRFGEKAFRKIEKLTLQKILAKKPLVLATGGGVVLDFQNRQRLKQKGFVVWLKVPLRSLLGRLQHKKSRPLLPERLSLGDLEKIYKPRLPFYRQCHCAISNTSKSPKDLAILILKKYRAFDAPGSPQ